MADAKAERVALMAIHPEFADAILAGEKLVEFRKRRLADDITTVLMYATAPIQRVVGHFRVGEIVVGSPQEIWESFGDVGEIDRHDFDRYYAEADSAVAIGVTESTAYAAPLRLEDLDAAPAIPQSVTYLRVPALA